MMYRVYDGLTGLSLSFKYTTREQAEHVEQTMKHVRFNTIVLPCTPDK